MSTLDHQALREFWDRFYAACAAAQAEADARSDADLKLVAAQGRLANIPAMPGTH